MTTKVKPILIGIHLLFLFNTFAFGMGKPNPLKALLRSAFEKYNQGQYYEAVNFYQKALTYDSLHEEANYYLGDCYRYLFQYESALTHYQRVKLQEKSEYPLITLNLGLVHKSLAQYDQAAYFFRYFIQYVERFKQPEYEFWISKAEEELTSISVVKSNPLTPVKDIEMVKMPFPINSESHDLAAFPYPNTDMLVVTSTRQESRGNQYHDQHGESFSDNFLFVLDSNGWHESTDTHRFSSTNSPLDEGPGAISTDQTQYFLTKYTARGDYHIYVSYFQNGHWQTPEALPETINMPGYFSKHPSLSASGDTLFFSSNRPGGFGESDLWMCTQVNGKWQQPKNLGSDINSPYQDTSPYWDVSQKILFFASNGHQSWGGYDIFMSYQILDNSLNQVLNLGKPINSSKDDTYFWLGENNGYLTSNRGNTSGKFDIFKFQYIPEPKVLLALGNQTLWDKWISQLYFQFSEEEQGAYKFYTTLPSQEKERLQRTVREKIFNALISDDVGLEALDSQHKFTSPIDKKGIQALLAHKKSFYLSLQIPTWSEDIHHWYEELPMEEKKEIEKLVHLMMIKEFLQESEDNLLDENYTYEKLSVEEKAWIDQSSERGIKYFQELLNHSVSLEELYQWQTLPAEEKEKLERALTYQYFTHLALSDEATINDVQHQYELLPQERKEQIDRMARAISFEQKASATILLHQDSGLLDSLSEEDKKKFYLMVVYRSRALQNQNVDESGKDNNFWQVLPQESKNAINKAVNSRQFAMKALSEVNIANEGKHQQINLHTILKASPDIVNIRGKVGTNELENQPIKVSLGNKLKNISTQTKEDGTFAFEKVKYRQSQQILLGDQNNNLNDILSLYLESLEITVVEDSQFVASFDNIYFQTDKYQITKEALPIISHVVDFHKKHPDVLIEIHAYADSVGSQQYNYTLSERRGAAVYQAMIENGVAAKSVKIVPRGKEEVDPSKYLSYSRRVEFKISGNNTSYNPTKEIYVLEAKPDLEKIAEKYQVSVDHLLSINPGLLLQPAPYTIIKITTKRQAYDQ
ncbi:outer membrane protein OmpA-like peptidoglycan-associated protein [Catalinimonas alkaloidigena]|uniref:OmpA family protein n=1 Tax=Catalinimonas alkaloidigena TaxID=1075417 RepID=UPI0024064767|nr:OmpA family protein [Catalinimonas alkaloidigena]MDF9798032.1 outer membrane protein OmpA-like peptidoglycan-associated protein [Catalinimonas alkaloidigena]